MKCAYAAVKSLMKSLWKICFWEGHVGESQGIEFGARL